MKQQRMMGEQDVVDALRFGKELPHLKDQFKLLVEEINSLEDKRNSLRAAISALQNRISAARDSLKIWQSALDDKIQEVLKKARDVTNIGHYSSGKTEITIKDRSEIPYVLPIVKQAYEKS
jgi:predicted transport protein